MTNTEIPSVLRKIVEAKKEEIQFKYETGRFRDIVFGVQPRNKSQTSFYDAIAKPRTGSPNLIAEFKITSPSNIRKGRPDFITNPNPAEIALIYEANGASAMSVLTDIHFKGDLDHLYDASEAANIPTLRKDFIIHPLQVAEARYYGASAILLISALLGAEQMKDYIAAAGALNMDCLVESHNREELEKAVEAGARIFGINNRNLHDFSVSLDTTLDLLQYVPEGRPVVTESGIHNYEDVRRLSDSRINAMLIGEGIISAPDIPAKMRELLGRAA